MSIGVEEREHIEYDLLREDRYLLIDLRQDDKDGFVMISVGFLMDSCKQLPNEIVTEYGCEELEDEE